MTHVHVARQRAHEHQERVQREHELNRALEAARTLEARLELLGDRRADVEITRSLRNSLARDLALVGTVVVVPRGPRLVELPPVGDDSLCTGCGRRPSRESGSCGCTR